MDPLALSIAGVRQLVGSKMNKTSYDPSEQEEGVLGYEESILSLKLSDTELLLMKTKWEQNYRAYEGKITTRQKRNKAYYLGTQKDGGPDAKDTPIASNLIFEAVETFIPAAMAKNPEPVVWSDNTEEGKQLSNNIKTMLQYHSDVLVLRRKLALMVRHWNFYFLGAIKHGWDDKINDITSDVIQTDNLILDPESSIDVSGNYDGKYLGERKKCTAEQLIEMFPKQKAYIVAVTEGKLGTEVMYTEWWTNEYCFYTFKDIVLDKNMNPNFNYGEKKQEEDMYGNVSEVEVPAQNHFARPKMPYSFLSVFSTGEHPHDVTNLIEQNIQNQDLISKRITQIDQNLDHSNNSLAVSGLSFTAETAQQAAQAMQKGNPVLVPQGDVREAITRFPAPGLPNDAFQQLNDMTTRLRSVFGTEGISSQAPNANETVRGKILNNQYDSSRIGGGIGDALEQLADTIFNWWLQMYYVYYDEPHEAQILGRGRAIEYSMIKSADIDRKVVVSVAPNSMRPKDELTEMNLAVDRWNNHSIDPIGLMKALNSPDPMEEAKRLVMWTTNPEQYAATFFPEVQAAQPPQQGGPESQIQPNEGTLSEGQGNPALSQVPINQGAAMPS